ncbi:hypothetical protein J132_04224 [Termitomyces sp. J132]|nr:hypothetical protein J132_04224 [Termitomyces sp. J132]
MRCTPPLLGTNRFSCLSIEKEIAFSNAPHYKTEEPQFLPPNVQTQTLESKPSSPMPARTCHLCPACEHQMPWQYVVASSPSTNSLCLDMKIETMGTQQTHKVTALLNNGATGLSLDSEFVKHHGLTMQLLSKPIPVFNIDRMPNKVGTISSMVNLVLHYWNHAEHAVSLG